LALFFWMKEDGGVRMTPRGKELDTPAEREEPVVQGLNTESAFGKNSGDRRKSGCCCRGCCRLCCRALSVGILIAPFCLLAVWALEPYTWSKSKLIGVGMPVFAAVIFGLTLFVAALLPDPACCWMREATETSEPRKESGWRKCRSLALHLFCSMLCAFVFFLVFVLLIRKFRATDLDDVTPGGECPLLFEEWVDSYGQITTGGWAGKARILWIIPLYQETDAISNHTDFVDAMKKFQQEGAELGMHGVFHQGANGSREFELLGHDQSAIRARIDLGLEEWRRAFGNDSRPTLFSFPGYWGTRTAVDILRDEYNFSVRNLWDAMTRKIYHCDTGWCSVVCKDWFQDLF